MPMTYLQLAEKVLDETPRNALSPTEIWKAAETKQLSAQLEQKSKKPVNTLYGAMFTDSRDNPNSTFARIGTRPIRYYLKKYESEISKEAETTEGAEAETTDGEQPPGYSEADLHQILAYFVRTQFQAYAKTIKHARGPKKEFGEWVHPDVIGVYYPFKDFKYDVVNLSAHLGGLAVKMYSFEIKKSFRLATYGRHSFRRCQIHPGRTKDTWSRLIFPKRFKKSCVGFQVRSGSG